MCVMYLRLFETLQSNTYTFCSIVSVSRIHETKISQESWQRKSSLLIRLLQLHLLEVMKVIIVSTHVQWLYVNASSKSMAHDTPIGTKVL